MTFQTWSGNSRILASEGLVMAVMCRTAKIARRCSRSLSNIMYVAFYMVGNSWNSVCRDKSNCFWRNLSSLEARQFLLEWTTSFLAAAAAPEIYLIFSPALTLSCRVCAKQRIWPFEVCCHSNHFGCIISSDAWHWCIGELKVLFYTFDFIRKVFTGVMIFHLYRSQDIVTKLPHAFNKMSCRG